MSDIKYPDVVVELVGQDGNAFAIIGNVSRALRKANVDRDDIDIFRKECMSGDYNNVLQTVMKWVSVE